MTAIIIPINPKTLRFQKSIHLFLPIPAKDAFDKNNHRNHRKELRRKVLKSNARIKRNSWEGEDKYTIYGHSQICSF